MTLPVGSIVNYGLDGTLVTDLDANGDGVGTLYNNNSGVMMVIFGLAVITNPVISGCTCIVTPPIGVVDTSYFAGTGDVAQGIYYLRAGSFLKLTWDNGPHNGKGIATYFYHEVLV